MAVIIIIMSNGESILMIRPELNEIYNQMHPMKFTLSLVTLSVHAHSQDFAVSSVLGEENLE